MNYRDWEATEGYYWNMVEHNYRENWEREHAVQNQRKE